MSKNKFFPKTTKIILWSFLIIFGFVGFNLIAMPKIFGGKSLSELLEENSIKTDLPDKVNKLTSLKISQDTKIIYLKSLIFFNGEGDNRILLEFTPQQSQELIKQIELQTKWQKISAPYKFDPCMTQIADSIASATEGKTTYYEISTLQQNHRVNARFCPENNRLKITENFL
ncbi:MAG TPA: hypothetical protein VK184_01060 [Nostocaceae cyanobacterium]|nr:hypothetical protein [Nostocaceae cyanobacterium]